MTAAAFMAGTILGGCAQGATAAERSPTSDVTISSANPEYDLDTLVSENPVRPANFYKLDWSIDDRLCSIALKSLNKPYAVPENLRTWRRPSDNRALGKQDYATQQAAYYLGTNENVRWSLRTFNAKTSKNSQDLKADVAVLDFFNDGVSRLIIRRTGSLSNYLRTFIMVRNPHSQAQEFETLNYRGAFFGSSGLPDSNELGSKFDYSVKDIIRLNGEYYTLLMPLQARFNSYYIYLIHWREAQILGDMRNAERGVSCVFSPNHPEASPRFVDTGKMVE